MPAPDDGRCATATTEIGRIAELSATHESDVTDEIVEALRGVYDPCCRERGISVVDMGLIRGVAVDGDQARVELILTTGACPFVVDLLGAVKQRVESLPGLRGAQVDVTWDEAWTSNRLSDDARRKLRFLPEPAAVADRDAYLRQKGATP